MLNHGSHERTRAEIFDALREFDVPGGPVRLMADLLTCEQLRSREFLQTVALADGTTAEVPAQPYIVREARGPAWRPGPASGAEPATTPSAGAHNEDALRDLPAAPAAGPPPPTRTEADPPRPIDWLRGTRVLDLTWYQAGPYANMILASFGAEILKIESHRRTDPFRKSRRHQSVSLADLKTDDWIDMGYRFNEDNMGKRSVAMDISQERGRDFLRQLVADADVVIEGFRPGTIERLGLGFDRLIEVNPRLVMVSLSANGATPPDGHMSGYAAVFGATSGLSGLSGYDRSVPAEYRGPLDQRVGTAVAMATLVGLRARDRSGSAVFVDVAAQEAGAALVGDQLLEWQLRGCVAEPLGNRHAQHAPHNVYQCLPIEGEQAWLVLAVETDEQWARLAEHLGDWRLDLALGRPRPQGAGACDRRRNRRLDARSRSRRADRGAAEPRRRRRCERNRTRPLRGPRTSAHAACGRASTTRASATSRCSPCPGSSTARASPSRPPRRSAPTTSTSTASCSA